LVFVRTKDDTEFILEYIRAAWIKADNIHRNRSQNARQRALKALKDWEIKVLVATDIASRWLDIDDLSCVINYNIPSEPDDYVHRIWRTARAGKKWVAISFCIDKEEEYLEKVEKLIWKKVEVNTDEKYKDEVIPKWKILWYANFEEDWKEKFKKKTRKSTWINAWKSKIWANWKKKRHYGKKK
jgi:ATP-dependent RNA helicase RhlE